MENVSWIDPERVPSWLRPFTLDSRTRFTRTPDSLLRPRDGADAAVEQASALPLLNGTAAPMSGRSNWYFLVDETDEDAAAFGMPVDNGDGAPVRDRLAAGAVIDLAHSALGDDADDELVFAEPLPAPAAVALGTGAPVADVSGDATAGSGDSDFSGAAPVEILAGGAFERAPDWADADPFMPAVPAAPWSEFDAVDAPAPFVPEPGHASGAGFMADDAFAAPEMAAEPRDGDAGFAAAPVMEAESAPSVAEIADFDAAIVSAAPVVCEATFAPARDAADGCFAAQSFGGADPAYPGEPAFTAAPLLDAAAADGFSAGFQDSTFDGTFDGTFSEVIGDMTGAPEDAIGDVAFAADGAAFHDAVEEPADALPAFTESVAMDAVSPAHDGSGADSLAPAMEAAASEDVFAAAPIVAGDDNEDDLAGQALPDEDEADAPFISDFPDDLPMAAEVARVVPAPAHIRRLSGLIVVGEVRLAPAEEQDRAPLPPGTPAPADPTRVMARFAWAAYPSALLSCSVETPAPDAPMEAAAAPVAAPPPPAPAAAAPAAEILPPALLPEPAVDPSASSLSPFDLPPIDLLRDPPEMEPDFDLSEEALDRNSSTLGQVLRDFGVRGEVIDANPGPVVTLYEFEPAPGIKSSRVIGLAADLARSMSALSVRVAVVEGRNVIGIELPNRRRETVWLRELLSHRTYAEAHTKLGICLGKTIGGEPVIVDLARMPHLLVAGTTGSGKSVAINTMILSLLYRHTPDTCRLIMIDPKMLELSVYEGIPHLLTPVVTDPKKAIIALKWAVKEMEDRYRKMSRLAVRNIDGFNARVKEAAAKSEVIRHLVQAGFDKENGEPLFEERDMDLTPLPYIVVVVDEMADLMMVAGKEIEGAIQRLAQMARAAGIHLIMATQRPSVDVITGTIKANFPTRISFQVTSKIDSRTILGEMGAEQLLGQGDMLYMAGGGRISRVHGPFVSDEEVEHVVAFLKAQGGPDYLDAVVLDEDAAEVVDEEDAAVFDRGTLGETGDLYEQAVAVVLRDRKASTSYIQRRLQVGYNKAASLMERMENEGIVGPANHAGKREILLYSRPE